MLIARSTEIHQLSSMGYCNVDHGGMPSLSVTTDAQ